jgi:hypothetical protein
MNVQDILAPDIFGDGDFGIGDLNFLVTGDVLGSYAIDEIDKQNDILGELQKFTDGAISSVRDADYRSLLIDPAGGLLLIDTTLKSPLGQAIENASGQELSEHVSSIVDQHAPEQVKENVEAVGKVVGDGFHEIVKGGAGLIKNGYDALLTGIDMLSDHAFGTIFGWFKQLKGPLLIVGGGMTLAYLGNSYLQNRVDTKPKQEAVEKEEHDGHHGRIDQQSTTRNW